MLAHRHPLVGQVEDQTDPPEEVGAQETRGAEAELEVRRAVRDLTMGGDSDAAAAAAMSGIRRGGGRWGKNGLWEVHHASDLLELGAEQLERVHPTAQHVSLLLSTRGGTIGLSGLKRGSVQHFPKGMICPSVPQL